MDIVKGPSLRTKLYLLVLLAFIPIGVLILYTAETQKQIEKQTIFRGAMLLAKAAAIEEQQQVDAAHKLLAAMNDALLANRDDAAALSKILSMLRMRLDGYAELGFMYPDGRIWATTLISDLHPDYSRHRWFLECLQHKTLVMGGYTDALIDGQPVLFVAMPILGPQQTPIAVAFAAMDLMWLNRSTFKLLSELPIEARLTLIDGKTDLRRYDAALQQWTVPTELPASTVRQIMARQSGILVTEDEKGLRWIHAFTFLDSPLKQHRIYVSLDLPEKMALAASRELFIRNMAILIFFALMTVLAIWWAADVLILRRVRTLVGASRRIARGDLTARIGDIGGHDELRHLASVFNEMTDSLQTREAQEQKALRALQESREQLRNLAAHQQQVREQERIRIARELHDEFGQSLTILKIDLAWIKKRLPQEQAEAAEKIDTMFQVISHALKSLHAVMAELRPVILDDFGLAAAIEWQADEFQNRTGIACRVDIINFSPPPDKELETVVFRIFQELLTNIIRHAQAKKVQVVLHSDAERLSIEVSDDGRGIKEAEINAPGSYGLMGIRERLHPWNGTVAFEGKPGQGTRVVVELPL